MATSDPLESRARRLALENALAHEGGARPGPIVARLLATDPALRSRSADVTAVVGRTVAEVNGLAKDRLELELASLGGAEAEGKREERSGAGELPALPGAEPGKVVLRMAPFPSGALHLGNLRMLFLNDAYRRRYDGQLYLVFDDTIGSEEKRVDLEIFDLIREDLAHADIPVDRTFYKSDRVPRFYPWARRVIEKDAAYVCTCPATVLRERRAQGIACEHRAQDRATTLEEWERMLGGSYGEGEAVLRLRTDPHDPDPAFRDRVLFRISELDHPRVGRKYRVWPMLEFSWAVDDVELGITHVIRGKDLVTEDRMQQFIWDLLGIRGPPFLHWGLLRVREAKLSKSKSYAEVKSGAFDGWADPRTWSLQSLERRGIRLAAVRRFTLSFGLSLSDIEVPAETLYAENRQLIDPTTMRRAFVPDPVRVEVAGYPAGLDTVTLPNHPERTELGTRTVRAGPTFYLPRSELVRHAGGEIRLKDLLNVAVPKELPPPDPMATVPVTFTSRENKKLPRIQWVGAEGSVAVDVLQVDGTHTIGRGEAALAVGDPGTTYQFERYGFVRVASSWARDTEPVAVSFGHP